MKLRGIKLNFERVKRSFYSRDTLDVAQELLGKYLVRQIGQERQVGKIVETEAYIGQDDDACHASGGKTKRNEVMFEKAGCAYVYMIYGMYWCLNIVTERKGFPSAVLVRALEPVKFGVRDLSKSEDKIIKMNNSYLKSQLSNLADGPGKLCRWMKINKKLNGEDLVNSNRLWIEDRGEKLGKKDIIKTTRVGIDYAQNSKGHPWRFYIKNNPFISKK